MGREALAVYQVDCLSSEAGRKGHYLKKDAESKELSLVS